MNRTFLLLLLVIPSLACYTSSSPSVMTAPSPAPAATVIPVMIKNITPEPTAFVGTFTVIADLLYIRDLDDIPVGVKHQGDLVTCRPAKSGWCMLEQGRRVWSGCLSPNFYDLGCEAR